MPVDVVTEIEIGRLWSTWERGVVDFELGVEQPFEVASELVAAAALAHEHVS